MNLTAQTKLLRVSPCPDSPRMIGAWAIQASHQFPAGRVVRGFNPPRLPSPPEFSWAANAPFSRFVRKINDIIGVFTDTFKTLRGFIVLRIWNSVHVLFLHSVYLVSRSHPFEKQSTGWKAQCTPISGTSSQ